MGVMERYEAKKKKQSIDSDDTKIIGVKDRYDARNSIPIINFDTFESDLKSMGTTIQGIYDGWQSKETMDNTLSSIKDMQKRIEAYQKYQSVFGGTDLTDVADSYKAIVDDWHNRTFVYGLYKNAELFESAKRQATFGERYSGYSYDMIQKYKSFLSPDTEEYKYLDSYIDYTDLNDFKKALENVEDKNSDYYRELEKAANKYELEHGTFDLYKHYMKSEDYDEKSKYWGGHKFSTDNLIGAKELAKGIDADVVVYDKTNKTYTVYKDALYDYINNQNNAQFLLTNRIVYGDTKTGLDYESKGYHKLNSEEAQLFNYLDWYDGENGTNLAQEFLDGMEMALTKREYDEKTQKWKDAVDSSGWAAAGLSLLSVPANVYGAFGTITEGIDSLIEGRAYNPYAKSNTLINFASDTRKYTGENISEATKNLELWGQNIPTFLYQTGMSILDTTLGGATFGRGYTVVAGSSAFQQKAKEMKEAGENDDIVFKTAFASGAAEMVFEYISLDKLIKIKNVDSLKKIFAESLKQAGIEASEELATELANIFSDTAIRGKNSELSQMYEDLKARGYSESEIKTEIAKQVGGQLTWAAIGGFLSGGVMGGAQSIQNYVSNKATGSTIRGNERTQDLLNVAQLTPRESETYRLYTDYAVRNNPQNITDAQLGALYSQARMDSENTLESRKRSVTIEDKAKALRTRTGLNKVDTENVEAKRVKELTTGEETMVTSSGKSANIEGIKLGDDTTLVTSEGEVSAKDMTLSQRDAELVAFAEQMSEEEANLFLAQDDGTTNVSDYANSFNLVKEYAKHNYTQDVILENKGVLSTEQVKGIYEATVKATFDAQQKMVDSITQKHSKSMFVQGSFNDSIIDYSSKATDGSRVNWNSLTSTQRKAIKFAQLFAKATGVNIKLIKSDVVDGKHKGSNGYYDAETNTIAIDVYAGRIDASTAKDSIIPTLSHEVTHWMKAKAPSIYNAIREDVIGVLARDGKTSEDIINAEIARLDRVLDDKKHTPEDAIDELVARACEDMLSNSKTAREMLSKMTLTEQTTFKEKVKEIFDKLLKWVNDLLGQYKSESAEAKLLREYKEMFEKISEEWDAMLSAAIESNQALQSEGIIAEELVNGISKDGTTIVGKNKIQMSERTYENGGRDFLIKWMDEQDLSKEDKEDILRQTDMIKSLMEDIRKNNELPDYAKWAAMDVVKDENGEKVLSVIVKNGDYAMNIDFSQVCKKRVALNAVLNAMVQSGDLNAYTLTETDVADLNAIIKEHDFEIACALCFVDSKRYRVGSWAESFCEGMDKVKNKKTVHQYGFNEMVRSLIPKDSKIQIEEFNFTNREIVGQPTSNLLSEMDDSELDFTLIDEILEREYSEGKKPTDLYAYAKAIKDNPSLRKILNPAEIISSIGLDSIRLESPELYRLINRHQGTAKPKFAHDVVAYTNDILKASNFTKEKAKMVGGVRCQSFSDFMANMVFDYVQFISELSAKELTAHTYTKEPLFVKLFGLTGMKINMSLVPKAVQMTPEQQKYFAILNDPKANKRSAEYQKAKRDYEKLAVNAGLDANGNYIWEDETFPYDIAMDIVVDPRYSANCGTIAVGISDNHILKLINDERISMVIPYHKSGLNHIVAMMRNIDLYNDYTKTQNTRFANGKKLEKVPDFDFYGDLYGKDGKEGTHDPKKTADNYLKWCDENNYIPKFEKSRIGRRFRDNPNYYKLLVDFRVYDTDGTYREQQAVKPIYPENEEFKDLILNGVKGKDGKVYGGLKQQQNTSDKLDAESKQIVDEFKNKLKDKYGKDVLAKKNSDREITPISETEYTELENHFGTKFSMRESVEEAKDLVAIHNITPELLIDALNRRGLLAPSLAITNKGHSSFGAISLLFDKNTIDPNVSKENKLYGSDAWTPTQTRLKKNAKFDTNKTVEAVRNIKNLIGGSFVSELFDINPKQFRDTIIKADGSIYDAYAHNIGMQTAYAIEQGILSNVPTKANGTVDKTALQEQLNSVLDTDKGWREYKKWLNNISDTIITSYDAATNEDILDNMKAQPSTAKTFKLSVNGELVVPAVEYDSIDALRSNKNKLSENAEEATKSVATDLLSWAKKVGSDTKSVVNAINSAFAHRYDVSGIVNSFSESGIKISHKAATELQGLYKQAVELPTQYFEAKPQRAVGLEEIKAVVMPEQSTYDGDLSEIRAELEKLGVPVIKYDYGSKESRVDALNSVDEVKFSDRDSEGNTLSKGQQEFFKDSKVRDEDGNLLVVYHGTDADFTVFEKKKGVRSFATGFNYEVESRGFFFTSDISYASEFGKKLKAYYIDVKKPLLTDNDSINLNNLDETGKTKFYDNDRIDELYYILEPVIKDMLRSEFEQAYSLYEDTDENIKLKKRWALKDLWEFCDGDIYRNTSIPWEIVDNKHFDECLQRMEERGYDGFMVDEGEGMPNSWFVVRSNQAKLTTNKNPTSNPDIRYSDRETLDDAADKLAKISDEEYLKERAETPFILVMDNTPSVVLDTMIDGNKLAKDRPILIRRDALYLAIRESGVQEGHYHGLGAEVIKKLPEYLEKPDVILKTDSSENKRLVLSHIDSKNGQAIISVEFESIKTFDGKDNYYNVIVTVFDLHENYLKSLFKKHKAEIKYEKEDLEQLNPQLYKWLRTINSKSSKDSLLQDDGKSQEKHSDRDYTITDNRAAFTEKHINDLYEDYSVSSTSDMMKDYAQAYVAYINPSDFLSITSLNGEKIRNEAVDLDLEKLQAKDDRELPYLEFDEETGEVYEHDGRHRLVAFENAGIEQVAIRLLPISQENKYHRKKIDIVLKGQEFNWRNEKGEIVSGRAKGEVKVTAYPLSPSNRPVIEQLFGTGKMLYSDRNDVSVYDTMGETDRLIKENDKLKADVERLKERLKIERQVTHGNYFNENQLNAVAGHLRNIAMSDYSKPKLVELLKEVYSYIAHSENLNWEDMFAQCCDVARTMLSEAKEPVDTNDYVKEILSEVRKTRIRLNDKQKSEAKYMFGNRYMNAFMGRVIITENGTPLDVKWQEWSSEYPDYFDGDIQGDAQLVAELHGVLDSLKQASETYVEYNEEDRVRWLAEEIYNQYWNVSTIKTTADKYDKQIKRLNFEHRKMMTELRNDYEERMSEQKKTERERTRELVRDIRERKDREISDIKKRSKERMDAYKENAEKKTKIQSITANALTLNKWLKTNSKDHHIHEAMKGPVAKLLQAIDFSSNRMLEKGVPTQKDVTFAKAFADIEKMLIKAEKGEDGLVELYGHDLGEGIKMLVEAADRLVGDNNYVINKMTLEELNHLERLVKYIKKVVTDLNKFHTVNHAKGIANLSQDSMEYLDKLGKAKVFDGLRGGAKKLLEWGNALPYYVFKRYGKGGQKIFEAFQDGWDKFAFHIKEIIDYSEKAYKSEEVKEWGNDIKTFKVLVPATDLEKSDPNYKPSHQTVQMSVSQIMSLYCLTKREQARNHILQGGIRIADIKGKKGEIISQSEGIVLTYTDVANIIGTLSSRQKAVADKLQEFMNTICTDWGNEVSMKRFGYKAFGEENYFPIQSDKNNLAVNDETEQNNSLFRLLNMSFTKALSESANNRVVISDIFDVFAQHTSDMAKYNSLALPVLDAFKWYNYNEKIEKGDGTFITKGVKQSIESAFGKDGQNYFTQFMKDLNGEKEVTRDTVGKHFFTNAKIAAVGLNLRVMALQPTSYIRASAVIDNKYLTKALLHKPKIDKAKKHCGMALWKSMGYYDTNVQKGVEEQIKHETTFKDKATEWSMKGAGIADELTWGYLWNACELEVRDKRKDLKVGSEEFYKEIGNRLREVIYATQVVDSTMTRSQMMRGNGIYEKMLTAFASEPTLAYNMLQDAYMGWHLDARSEGKKQAWKNNGKKIARVVTAYTLTNVMTAIVEAGFDAFRDDDEEEMDFEEFMKLFLTNFASDVSITGKIPYVKEMHSFLKGFGSSRTDTQWMESLSNSIKAWWKIFNGEGNPEKAFKYSLKALSDLFGLPFFNAYRDFMATLDKLHILSAEEIEEMFK